MLALQLIGTDTAAGQAKKAPGAQPATGKPRNVILFISDGAGPATFTMTRDYAREVLGWPGLVLDAIQVGAVRTRSSSNRVTDSAAGATAYATGYKTYNGAIGVDPQGRPVATLLEAAEARGLSTGLVSTSSVTHATPAAFSAHVAERAMETDIALQQTAKGIEVLLGGGRRFYTTRAAGGQREDGRDLVADLKGKGVQVVGTRQELLAIRKAPVVGLFADNHMAFDMDRDSLAEPSLAEMTTKAIELLKGDPDGFFLMVEGSRIDFAGHGNDPVAMVNDVLAYNRAVARALEFARKDGNTLVVSVSDHETGGLTLGRNVGEGGGYTWEPAALSPVRRSIERMAADIINGSAAADVLRDGASISDLTEDELKAIAAGGKQRYKVEKALSDVISRRAIIGWAGSGHTAVDVNLYAFGPGRDQLIGNHENEEVGDLLAALLGLDLEKATAILRAQAATR